ncbi:UNVERIFIED_CONTAM: hypothetical protein HDU68_012804 [Siphonaria sp. JEL0065]|nr:hypothetical protein HDU68_012804 [Siphonaria sp. JEL0065]
MATEGQYAATEQRTIHDSETGTTWSLAVSILPSEGGGFTFALSLYSFSDPHTEFVKAEAFPAARLKSYQAQYSAITNPSRRIDFAPDAAFKTVVVDVRGLNKYKLLAQAGSKEAQNITRSHQTLVHELTGIHKLLSSTRNQDNNSKNRKATEASPATRRAQELENSRPSNAKIAKDGGYRKVRKEKKAPKVEISEKTKAALSTPAAKQALADAAKLAAESGEPTTITVNGVTVTVTKNENGDIIYTTAGGPAMMIDLATGELVAIQGESIFEEVEAVNLICDITLFIGLDNAGLRPLLAHVLADDRFTTQSLIPQTVLTQNFLKVVNCTFETKPQGGNLESSWQTTYGHLENILNQGGQTQVVFVVNTTANRMGDLDSKLLAYVLGRLRKINYGIIFNNVSDLDYSRYANSDETWDYLGNEILASMDKTRLASCVTKHFQPSYLFIPAASHSGENSRIEGLSEFLQSFQIYLEQRTDASGSSLSLQAEHFNPEFANGFDEQLTECWALHLGRHIAVGDEDAETDLEGKMGKRSILDWTTFRDFVSVQFLNETKSYTVVLTAEGAKKVKNERLSNHAFFVGKAQKHLYDSKAKNTNSKSTDDKSHTSTVSIGCDVRTALVSINPYKLTIFPDVITRLETILEENTHVAHSLLVKFFEEIGTVIPTQVIVGGNFERNVEIEYKNSILNELEKTISQKMIKVLLFSSKAASESADKMWEDKSIMTKADNLTIRGGQIWHQSYPLWKTTINPADPKTWDIVEIREVTPILDLLPKHLAERITQIFSTDL